VKKIILKEEKMMNVLVCGINKAISVCLGIIDGIKRIKNGEAGTVEKIKF
jgi:hypothetical protein